VSFEFVGWLKLLPTETPFTRLCWYTLPNTKCRGSICVEL